jgi:hypothetical protein
VALRSRRRIKVAATAVLKKMETTKHLTMIVANQLMRREEVQLKARTTHVSRSLSLLVSTALVAPLARLMVSEENSKGSEGLQTQNS